MKATPCMPEKPIYLTPDCCCCVAKSLLFILLFLFGSNFASPFDLAARHTACTGTEVRPPTLNWMIGLVQ